jgi:hypothetical protein
MWTRARGGPAGLADAVGRFYPDFVRQAAWWCRDQGFLSSIPGDGTPVYQMTASGFAKLQELQVAQRQKLIEVAKPTPKPTPKPKRRRTPCRNDRPEQLAQILAAGSLTIPEIAARSGLSAGHLSRLLRHRWFTRDRSRAKNEPHHWRLTQAGVAAVKAMQPKGAAA